MFINHFSHSKDINFGYNLVGEISLDIGEMGMKNEAFEGKQIQETSGEGISLRERTRRDRQCDTFGP